MPERFEFDVITPDPTAPRASGEGAATLQELRNENAELKEEIYALRDENDALQDDVTVESQKVRLLIPYANKAFWFCCIYIAASFFILFLQGFSFIPFELDKSTMNLIAGSNIASIIGLLTIMARGLFSK